MAFLALSLVLAFVSPQAVSFVMQPTRLLLSSASGSTCQHCGRSGSVIHRAVKCIRRERGSRVNSRRRDPKHASLMELETTQINRRVRACPEPRDPSSGCLLPCFQLRLPSENCLGYLWSIVVEPDAHRR